MDVYVQVPAFEEGDDMIPTLRSIQDQQTPEWMNITPEVWVTLSPPDKELCTTWQAALEAGGFDVYEAPSGKLSARNAAHDHAVADGADVIVTWDADAPALSDDTLFHLAKHFDDPGVSAVRGEPVSPLTPIGMLENVGRKLRRSVTGHIHGQLSAFSADGWRHAGPFDTSIDETNIDQVWAEEEVDFARRLREAGEMVHESEAIVHNDSRRTQCRISRAFERTGREPMGEWCQNRGESSFAPRDGPRRGSR